MILVIPEIKIKPFELMSRGSRACFYDAYSYALSLYVGLGLIV